MSAEFTQNWVGGRYYWPELLADYAGKPNLHFLEVGCFEGRATLWLLENILTHDTSRITVGDVFELHEEFRQLQIQPASIERFKRNTAEHASKITILTGRSSLTLRALTEPLDFAYIDGSHRAADVLSDAVLVWPVLKDGGIVAFDDYEWGGGRPEHDRPHDAIDAFLAAHEDQLTVLHKDYQVAVRKELCDYIL